MFFLGMCHINTLKHWNFCTKELLYQNEAKCTFKYDKKRLQKRVHRRFCDFNIMINNKDCKCKPTIFGEMFYKVIGKILQIDGQKCAGKHKVKCSTHTST